MIIPATVECNNCQVRYAHSMDQPWVIALFDSETGHQITASIRTLWELLNYSDHWCSHECMELSLSKAQRESEKRKPCQIPQQQL